MLRESRKDGVAVVENLGCWLDLSGAPGIGKGYRRAQPAWCFYYKTADRILAEQLKDPSLWRVSAFDGDISL